MSKKLTKPQMRGLYARNLKFHLMGAVITSITGVLTMKYFWTDPRRKRYEDFYKTYDPIKQEKIMADAGLLQAYGNSS